MSSKEKVKISGGKEEEWGNRVAECFKELFKTMSGKLLTTMEVAFPNGTQLFALKSRIRDVQGRTWDGLVEIELDVRDCFFEILPDTSEEVPECDFYLIRVTEFFVLLDQRVRNNLNQLERTVINLTLLVAEEEKKQEALTGEIVRIFAEVRNQMGGWLARAVEGEFGIKIE